MLRISAFFPKVQLRDLVLSERSRLLRDERFRHGLASFSDEVKKSKVWFQLSLFDIQNIPDAPAVWMIYLYTKVQPTPSANRKMIIQAADLEPSGPEL